MTTTPTHPEVSLADGLATLREWSEHYRVHADVEEEIDVRRCEVIRRIMAQTGTTATNICKEIGISEATFSLMVGGHQKMSPRVLLGIDSYFGNKLRCTQATPTHEKRDGSS